MTDDEIYNAWKEFDEAHEYQAFGSSWLESFKAGAEWATKRERERCSAIAQDYVDAPMFSAQGTAVNIRDAISGGLEQELTE
jgi:hypothetical protein